MSHSYTNHRAIQSGSLPELAAIRQMLAVVVADLGWVGTSKRQCMGAAAEILGMGPRRCRGHYHGEIRRLKDRELESVRSAFERHLAVQAAAFARRQTKLRGLADA